MMQRSNVKFVKIPAYAGALLMKAKCVLAAYSGQREVLPQVMKELENAVIEFEAQMPLKDGVVQEA